MQHKARILAIGVAAIGAMTLALVTEPGRSLVWTGWFWNIAQATESGTEVEPAFAGDSERWKNWLARLNAAGPASRVTRSDGTVEIIVPSFDRRQHFDVKVSVSWNPDMRTGGCGLVLGVSQEAQYAFAVTADGRASVGLLKANGKAGTELLPLSGPRFLLAIDRQRPDTLTVKVRGQKLAFLVNDQPVVEVVDTMMRKRWALGVFAQGHRNVSLDHFDQIR